MLLHTHKTRSLAFLLDINHSSSRLASPATTPKPRQGEEEARSCTRATAPSPSMEPEKSSSSLLGTLRTAVKKVRFLLSFSATRWILSSIVGTRASATPRRVSFNSRPSLLDVEDSLVSPARPGGPSRSASLGARSVSRTSSAAASELSPTSSGASSSPGDDDIDRRAELFIANFYKHIQMERQVSLQLRYCRESSLERTPSR